MRNWKRRELAWFQDSDPWVTLTVRRQHRFIIEIMNSFGFLNFSSILLSSLKEILLLFFKWLLMVIFVYFCSGNNIFPGVSWPKRMALWFVALTQWNSATPLFCFSNACYFYKALCQYTCGSSLVADVSSITSDELHLHPFLLWKVDYIVILEPSQTSHWYVFGARSGREFLSG